MSAKEIALHNAVRCNFVLLSQARFSKIEGNNSLPAGAFLKKIFPQEEFSDWLKFRGGGQLSRPSPATTPL